MKKVFVPGVFDYLHKGHTNIINKAKNYGEFIVVGVINDSGVKSKGKITDFNQEERFNLVKESGLADKIIFTDGSVEDYKKIYEQEKIDIHLVGEDHRGTKKSLELEPLGKIVYTDRTKDISSTMIRDEKRKLKTLQEIIIKMLDEVNNTFLENDIKWFAHAGTLLGAIRHGGIIPWDDDIDMIMTTKEMILKKDKIETLLDKLGYKLRNEMKDGNKTPYWKIVTKNKVSFDEAYDVLPFIDIMICDFVQEKITIDESKEIKKFGKMTLQSKNNYYFEQYYNNSNILMKKILGPIIFNLQKTILRIDSKRKILNTKMFTHNIETKYAARFDWQAHKMIPMKLTGYTKVDFGKIKLLAPDNIDDYFEMFYGQDWMVEKPIKNKHLIEGDLLIKK